MSSEQPQSGGMKRRLLQCGDLDWIRFGAGVALGAMIGTALGLLSGDLPTWIAMGYAIGGGIGSALHEDTRRYVWLGVDWLRMGAGVAIGVIVATVMGAFFGDQMTWLVSGYIVGGAIGILLQWWRPEGDSRQ